MSIFDLIPTSDNLMSQYTLIGFVIYTGILLLLARCCVKRMDKQEKSANGTTEVITGMRIDIAGMGVSLDNIAEDSAQTRTAIAEINRTLIDKL